MIHLLAVRDTLTGMCDDTVRDTLTGMCDDTVCLCYTYWHE